MRMLACCWRVGMLSVEVMAACDCGMLLLELVMPRIVLYSCDVPVL